MLIAEPVQNAGGCLVPPDGYWQGLREICDRHGILLVSDEVICAFGRIGTWFGAQRLGYEPDMITFAKGLTGAHFPMGGVLISERVAEPFIEGREMYLHGITFGGHPVGSAVALASIEIFEREKVLDNVMANEPLLRDLLNGAARHPDRRRRARHRPLLGDRAGPRSGDARDLRGPGGRMAAEGRALGRALGPRPDLPPRRPHRADRPDRPAAGRRPRRRSRRSPGSSARASPSPPNA